MTRFIVGRLGAGIVTVFVSSIVIFCMVRFIPGDPITSKLSDGGLPPEAVEALRRMYGLDRSLPVQYWSWISTVVRGDFGVSLITGQPVAPEVAVRIPRTIILALAGIGIGVLVAVPLSILSTRLAGRRVDSVISAGISVLVALPNFVIGTVLTVLLAVQLDLFPVAGYVDPGEDLGGFLLSLALPALSLGLSASGVIARVLRASLHEEMKRDYIRTAVARGASPSRTIVRHGLRNASLPAVTIVGLQIGYLLGGSLVIELLFSYPGLGLMLLNSITQRDYPAVQACLMFFAVAFVVVNLLTDILYAFINPRLKVGS